MGIFTNNRILWGIILLLIVMNLVTLGSIWIMQKPDPVFVRPGLVRNPPKPDGHFLKRHLNFSEEQEKKFDSLLTEHREKLETKADEIRSLREELMSKIRNQQFTPEAETLVNKIGEKQSELEMLNYRHFRDVMSICNEEQKDLFIQTIQRAVRPHHRRGDWQHDMDDRNRGRIRRDR